MFRISFPTTLPIIGLVSLMAIPQPFAQTQDPCFTKVCDTECRNYFVAHRDDIINLFYGDSTRQFAGVCGSIPKPDDRRQCYIENLADKEGFKPKQSEVENWAYRNYVESVYNPTTEKCFQKQRDQQALDMKKARADADKYNSEHPAPEAAPAPAPSKPKVNTQSTKTKLDKISARNDAVLEQQKAEVDKAAKDKEALLDQQSAANQVMLDQQQREIEKQRQEAQEIQNRQVDALNKQAELDFAAKGLGSNLLQQGFRSVLEGALNK